jgi:hypothetical protein
MTNVSSTPRKVALRQLLRRTAITALEQRGNKVERVPGANKSSVRRITKNKVSNLVSIRTTQDTWIAFPRNKTNTGWATLEGVDYVVVASVNNPVDPSFIHVHFLDAKDVRARFDRAYAARLAANYAIPLNRGIWISLYDKESTDPVNRVGAGAGLDKSREIARVPLVLGTAIQTVAKAEADENEQEGDHSDTAIEDEEAPLTINEAKRRLASSLGVDISAISITVHT